MKAEEAFLLKLPSVDQNTISGIGFSLDNLGRKNLPGSHWGTMVKHKKLSKTIESRKVHVELPRLVKLYKQRYQLIF